MHTATAECALLRLDVFAEVVTRGNHRDYLRFGVIGMTCEDTVDIAKENEHVGLHHLSNQTAQFIIIGEHQLGYAHGVVLIDDRYHPILKHHCHTSLLVFILLSRIEVFLHRQYLTDMQMMLAEKVIIQPYELHLTESREQLPLFNGVEIVIYLQFASATGNGSRRYEYHLIALTLEPSNLVDDSRHARDVEMTVRTCEHITAHLDYNSHFLLSFSLISTRLILPLMVLGKSSTNSMIRGYLYGAVTCLT